MIPHKMWIEIVDMCITFVDNLFIKVEQPKIFNSHKPTKSIHSGQIEK